MSEHDPTSVDAGPDRGLTGAMTAGSKRFIAAALDFILPDRCALCGTIVSEHRGLCGTCWSSVRFLQPPWCRSCGRPLPEAGSDAPLCPVCSAEAPILRRARAAVYYDDTTRRLLIGFKHHRRLAVRGLLTRWLLRAAEPLLGDTDLIVPVPLHRWRLLHRGFNQAALLASGLAEASGIETVPDLLRRHRATLSQQGLGERERWANVTARAFNVGPGYEDRLAGKTVLLVDDVLTTGATLAACALALRQHGAGTVDAVCVARVAGPRRVPIS